MNGQKIYVLRRSKTEIHTYKVGALAEPGIINIYKNLILNY
ncbi:hypothetical protein MCERE19_01970 [Spirosomataceae bacterium]|jgi:hypothetical protein